MKKSPSKAILGYKKVLVLRRGRPCDGHNDSFDRAIVTLRIPARAQIIQVRGEGGKCRANEAKVLAVDIVTENYGPKKPTTRVRFFARNGRCEPRPFFYKIGAVVKPRLKFSTDKKTQCASGIHFFKSKSKAVNHAW